MDSKTFICYHMADLDGIGSAAIIKGKYPEAILIPFDYNMVFDFSLIKKQDTVYMVDVSLPKDHMILLRNNCNLIWIDHHISKINELEGFPFNGIQKVGAGAIELVWDFVIKEPIPRGVKLLSRYDVWDLNPEVINYQYGIRALDLNPSDTESWIHNVFRDEIIPFHIKQGEVILNYLEQQNKKEVNQIGFITEFESYKVLMVNKCNINSLYFKDHELHDFVDILMNFSYDSRNSKWKVSLYTTKENIDVSAIAYKYGGGGHRKAAGAYLTYEQLPIRKE